MVVVSDATPLMVLAAVGQFDLLHKLYGNVAIPEAVYDEVAVAGAGKTGRARNRYGPLDYPPGGCR
jgi:predicted nucleic acid-binding protein